LFTLFYREILYSILSKISELSKIPNTYLTLYNIDLQRNELANLLFTLRGIRDSYLAHINEYELSSKHIIIIPSDIKNYALEMDNKCRKHIILKVLESAIKKIFNPFQEEVRSRSVLLQKINYLIASLEIDKSFINFPSYTSEKYKQAFIVNSMAFSILSAALISLGIIIVQLFINNLIYFLILYLLIYLYTSFMITMYYYARSYNVDIEESSIDKLYRLLKLLYCIFTLISFLLVFVILLVFYIVFFIIMIHVNIHNILLYLWAWITTFSIRSFKEIKQNIDDNMERLKRFEIYKEYFRKTS